MMKKGWDKGWRWCAALVLLCALCLPGCERSAVRSESTEELSPDREETALTIGSKGYTEQLILLKILAVYLKEHGYEVAEVPNMASAVARAALENGRIDMYWEYTGTALVHYHGRPAVSDAEKVYRRVRELDRTQDLVWLEKTRLNSSYAILMRRDQARSLGIATISDLAAVLERERRPFTFASSPEFAVRRDGLLGLQEAYGFEFSADEVSRMDTGLLYEALKNGQVDAVAGIATDGRIESYDLVVLEDDRAFFPAYNAAPVVRREVLEKCPELRSLINEIPPLLDRETMMRLTLQVDVDHEEIIEVVRNWLNEHELI